MADKSVKHIVIEPTSGWKMINVGEIIRYRDLLWFLVVRGIKARYAQSVLGVSWAIIQPLFTTLVFTIVFGNVAKLDSNGVPYIIFSFTAMVPWNYFSNTLTESSNSIVQNASMLSKVYFPRLVLPLSAAINKLLDFVIGFGVLVGFLIYFQMTPSWSVLYLPLLLLILLMNSLGIGMVLSAMAVQFRDVKHAITFLVQLLLYAAPVVYATTSVPAEYQFYYSLNPMVGVIEGFRSIFLQTNPMPWQWIWPGTIVALVIFVFGLFYFRRMERFFADVA